MHSTHYICDFCNAFASTEGSGFPKEWKYGRLAFGFDAHADIFHICDQCLASHKKTPLAFRERAKIYLKRFLTLQGKLK